MSDFSIDLCGVEERSRLINAEPSQISYVPYIDVHYRINCSDLKRVGLLEQPSTMGLELYKRFSVEVEYLSDERGSFVIFRYKLNNERFIETEFRLEWLERTYGKQPYFICNQTGKRVKHLLIVEGVIRSRHSFPRMNYYSEHESVRDRWLRAARRIRKRFNLEQAIDFPIKYMPKPKNIHRTTWEKWASKEERYYELIEWELERLVSKFKGW